MKKQQISLQKRRQNHEFVGITDAEEVEWSRHELIVYRPVREPVVGDPIIIMSVANRIIILSNSNRFDSYSKSACEPFFEMLKWLAVFFDVDPHYLLGWTDAVPPHIHTFPRLDDLPPQAVWVSAGGRSGGWDGGGEVIGDKATTVVKRERLPEDGEWLGF